MLLLAAPLIGLPAVAQSAKPEAPPSRQSQPSRPAGKQTRRQQSLRRRSRRRRSRLAEQSRQTSAKPAPPRSPPPGKPASPNRPTRRSLPQSPTMLEQDCIEQARIAARPCQARSRRKVRQGAAAERASGRHACRRADGRRQRRPPQRSRLPPGRRSLVVGAAIDAADADRGVAAAAARIRPPRTAQRRLRPRPHRRPRRSEPTHDALERAIELARNGQGRRRDAGEGVRFTIRSRKSSPSG